MTGAAVPEGPRRVANEVATSFGIELVEMLPGRSAELWRARRGEQELILRRDLNLLELGHALAGRSVRWQAEVRSLAAAHGWPTAPLVGAPLSHDGSWWTLEPLLPGEPRETTPREHAHLLASWHTTPFPLDRLGPRPGARDHLAVLADPEIEGLLAHCADPEDRSWLLRRLEEARALATGIDWSVSRQVLVHGDLTAWNLLWDEGRLSGILDLELATVGRRVSDLLLTWRCRYDELVLALDRIAPLSAEEWRMLLVDWWALMLDLAALCLRRGEQPDRWELDGLRRESPLSRRLARGEIPVT